MEKEHVRIWAKCLSLIREQVVPKKFRILFEPIRALKFQDGVLTLQLPSAYVHEQLEGEFIDVLRSVLQHVIGPNAKLMYSVVVDPKTSDARTITSAPQVKTTENIIYAAGPKEQEVKNPFQKDTRRIEIDSNLNPSYTMNSYIEGSCNRLARSAGMAIAQHPGGTAFNPLLIYGGSGLGKTHLAQAIGWEIKQNFPNKVVLYVPTNIFQSQFTEAVLRNELNNFMHFYQLIDVLILDDIQELAGKEATQRTFFHIFNHLQQAGKQLILTCDKAPVELQGMEERLLSRFRWGLAAEIKMPDYDTKREIFVHKARKDGMDFSEEVIDYICKQMIHNVRELEGVMISLLAQSAFIKRDLTLEVVQDILEKIVRRQRREEELTVSKIQQVVCEHFKVPEELLQTKTRKREIVQARQVAMYLSKNLTNDALSYIGRQLGKKDHATVVYACKVVADLMQTDRNFKLEVEEIQRKLYSGN